MEKIKISPFIYIILLGFSFAFLITSWIDYDLQKKTPLIIPNITQDYHYKRTRVNYSEILRKDILGIKRKNTTIITQPTTPPTNIEQEQIKDLKLLGLLKGKKNSYALILWHGEFFVLKKGENLKGLELLSIGFNKATFRYAEHVYTFKLNETNNNLQINTTKATQSLIANNINKSNSNEIYKTVISKQEILSRMGDINQVISSALFQPFYLDNKLLGYRIRFIRPGALLFRLGLRPGDIITGINDESLKNPQILFNLFSSIKNVKTVVVNLIRNGEKKTIIIDIK